MWYPAIDGKGSATRRVDYGEIFPVRGSGFWALLGVKRFWLKDGKDKKGHFFRMLLACFDNVYKVFCFAS